jgi:nucleotide-binding universal stress UspA family protein
MGGTVVCGVTDSASGRRAAELAGALTARLALRLVLVHVIRSKAVRGATTEPLSDAELAIQAIAHEVGNGAETRVVAGERADALAQVAAEEGADLIVLGSCSAGLRGTHIRSMLARELEEATAVPVVVAPPSTRRPSGRRLAVALGTCAS